jgi:hypothetical protein
MRNLALVSLESAGIASFLGSAAMLWLAEKRRQDGGVT